MDPDTFRNDIGVDVYWRRRLAALIAVLVVVAVVAWACSSSGGPQSESSAQTAPSGRSSAPDPLLAALPTITVTPQPTVSPSPQLSATPTPRPVKPAVRPKRPGDACDVADLVLSLQGEGEVYAAAQRPRFILTLVNTGKVMCVTDTGPRALEIRITSGDDRVWSSADCVSGETEDLRRFERGIPFVRVVEWDRQRSGSDCRAKRVTARPGTYVATVRATGMKSRKVVFHLR
ncbi:hypothetical protein ACFFMN_02265 [Planobispora siamensis]|uniref:Uncharacterized protein n=1 Tax=Planobispora siamensis TaxID=936338 RepID=A0A8J3SEX8_9ACTN|nr:hypothetical protein [Planobispora siamensis]GIH92978.1 hypothetical protein Psi01_36080 [Planobispora siamensis]